MSRLKSSTCGLVLAVNICPSICSVNTFRRRSIVCSKFIAYNPTGHHIFKDFIWQPLELQERQQSLLSKTISVGIKQYSPRKPTNIWSKTRCGVKFLQRRRNKESHQFKQILCKCKNITVWTKLARVLSINTLFQQEAYGQNRSPKQEFLYIFLNF